MRHQHGQDYRKIITSYRWQMLRASYLREHPVCELCDKEGRTSLAVDVHHRVPIESARTYPDMCALAYDRDNLQALCKPCHEAEHVRLGSNALKGRKSVREAIKRQANDFMVKWCGNSTTKQSE